VAVEVAAVEVVAVEVVAVEVAAWAPAIQLLLSPSQTANGHYGSD
jgi:hypothetical protein